MFDAELGQRKNRVGQAAGPQNHRIDHMFFAEVRPSFHLRQDQIRGDHTYQIYHRGYSFPVTFVMISASPATRPRFAESSMAANWMTSE
ncbi:hypothetical protein D1872_303070 [compost metagenome]